MPLDAATLLGELRTNPLDCLRHYQISIAGGSTSNSGVSAFSYYEKGGTVSGFTTGLSGALGKTKNRARVSLTRTGVEDPSADIADGKFNAHYVAMKQIGQDVQTTHYALPGDGPDIMLTSQLSGCSFGIGSNAKGAQLVSHIQPKSGEATTESVQQLHNAVTLGDDGGWNVFERQSDDTYKNHYATIVGVRTKAVWQFYVQQFVVGKSLVEAKQL